MGVKLEEFITWGFLIDHVCNKMSCTFFVLNSIKNIIQLNIQNIVYKSLIKVHMEYAAVAWGRCSINNSKIKKICILLKKKQLEQWQIKDITHFQIQYFLI